MKKRELLIIAAVICVMGIGFFIWAHEQKAVDYNIQYDGCIYDVIVSMDELTAEQKELMDRYGLNADVNQELLGHKIAYFKETDFTMYTVNGVEDNEIVIMHDNKNDVYTYALKSGNS